MLLRPIENCWPGSWKTHCMKMIRSKIWWDLSHSLIRINNERNQVDNNQLIWWIKVQIKVVLPILVEIILMKVMDMKVYYSMMKMEALWVWALKKSLKSKTNSWLMILRTFLWIWDLQHATLLLLNFHTRPLISQFQI